MFFFSELYLFKLQVDTAANVQPEKVDAIWNLRGILNTSWHKVQVRRASPGMNSNLWNKGDKSQQHPIFHPIDFMSIGTFWVLDFKLGTELPFWTCLLPSSPVCTRYCRFTNMLRPIYLRQHLSYESTVEMWCLDDSGDDP